MNLASSPRPLTRRYGLLVAACALLAALALVGCSSGSAPSPKQAFSMTFETAQTSQDINNQFSLRAVVKDGKLTVERTGQGEQAQKARVQLDENMIAELTKSANKVAEAVTLVTDDCTPLANGGRTFALTVSDQSGVIVDEASVRCQIVGNYMALFQEKLSGFVPDITSPS